MQYSQPEKIEIIRMVEESAPNDKYYDRDREILEQRKRIEAETMKKKMESRNGLD